MQYSEYHKSRQTPVSLTHSSPIHGALEKISSLRNRHRKVKASVDHYEHLVAEQTTQLRQLNRPSSRMSEYDDDNEKGAQRSDSPLMTEEDLKREEENIKELEFKKRTLEDRVNGMEKDLGGILR